MISPTNIEKLNVLTQNLNLSSQKLKAIEEEILSLPSESDKYWVIKGNIYSHLNQREKAFKCYRKGIELKIFG